MTDGSGARTIEAATRNPRHDELTERTERWLLWGLAAYGGVVAALMFVGGLRLTPDVLFVALALAAILIGRSRIFFRDWLPFIVIFLAYELMRGIADDAGFPVHVADVAAIEMAMFGGILPTAWLQERLAPADGVGPWAVAAVVVYMLHFALPIVTGFLLWARDRALYHSFILAFILLSFAGFLTYLFLPVAPPWFAANEGILNGADGEPMIRYLKHAGAAEVAEFLGFPDGRQVSSYVFYGFNPNPVAAFPSLHAAYPFLTFLVLRSAFGAIGWLALAYAFVVWWSIVFTGDHYVVDVMGGVAYAWAAFLVAPRLSGWLSAAVRRRSSEPPAHRHA